jgi:hypothetical protein
VCKWLIVSSRVFRSRGCRRLFQPASYTPWTRWHPDDEVLMVLVGLIRAGVGVVSCVRGTLWASPGRGGGVPQGDARMRVLHLVTLRPLHPFGAMRLAPLGAP